jgi:HEAT repeat protein
MGNRWRFDLWSALIGFVVAVVGAVILARLRQPVAELVQGIKQGIRELRRRLSAGVEGRYREEVVQYAQDRHLGVGAARLEQIFISPRFLRTLPEPDLQEESILPRLQLPYLWPELAARVAIEPPDTMTLGQMLGSVRRAAVIGPAGGGKSTTLAFLALACAEPQRIDDLTFAPETLPLQAHLAELELPSESDERETPIEEPLLKAIQRRAGTLTADRLPGALLLALKEGRALVLLDGWDELAPRERLPFTRWIGELMTQFPDNQYVVSAPLIGQGPLLAHGFVPLIMQSWDMADVTRLARRWAAALNATLPTVRERQRAGAAQIPALDFWQAGMTPLDTTLNLWLMLAGESPPLRAAPRYSASIHQLLAPFGTDGVNWPHEVGHQVLGTLAHQLDELDTQIATRAQLEETVHLVLSQREDAGGRAAQECLRVLGNLGGLLIPWGENCYVFQSPTLYGYFWAYQMVATQDSAAAQAKSRNPEWSPALRFYAEMADAGPLIESVLTAPADLLQEGLFQAASWVADAPGKDRWMRPILIRLAKLMVDATAPLALRERAAATLVGTQDVGVGYLLRQAMSSADPVLRATAAPGLGALATELPGRPGDKKALEGLIQALGDESEEVQVAAIHALTATRSEAAEEALIHTLLEATPPIRQVTAQAMVRMGEGGHEIIKEALETDEILVRRAALAGLALIDEPWAEEKLDHVLREDAEWLVRSAAEEILKKRQEQAKLPAVKAVQADSLAWLVSWAAGRGEGVPGGPAATALLQQVLKEGEPDMARAAAARSLADIGQTRFIQPLMAALQDPSRSVREAAVFALAAISREWNKRLTLGRETQDDV